MAINITINFDDFEVPNIEEIRDLKALVDQINQSFAKRSDIKNDTEESFVDIHNENWLAYPLADIPAAAWDPDNQCMSPGTGEVRKMRCDVDGRKDHYQTENVISYCPEDIPALVTVDCGAPVAITGVGTTTLGDECTEVCVSGTVTGAGSVTVTSGANSVVLAEGDVTNSCIALDGDVVVTATNATLDLTLQGRQERPNFVLIIQDTQCCEWVVIPCGEGGVSREEFEEKCREIEELKECLCALKTIVEDNIALTPEEQQTIEDCPCEDDPGPCPQCGEIPDAFNLAVKDAVVAGPVTITASTGVFGLEMVEAIIDAPCLQSILDALDIEITSDAECIWSGEVEISCDLLVTQAPGSLPTPGIPAVHTFTFRFGAGVNTDLVGNSVANFSLADVTSTLATTGIWTGFQANFTTSSFFVPTVACGDKTPSVDATAQNDYDISAATICYDY